MRYSFRPRLQDNVVTRSMGSRCLGTTRTAMADCRATALLTALLQQNVDLLLAFKSLSTSGRSCALRSRVCRHAPVWASSDALDERFFQCESRSALTFSSIHFVAYLPPQNVSLQRWSEPSQRQRGGETCLTQPSWKTVVVDRRRPESPHSHCTDNVGKTSTFLGDVSVATVVVL